MLEKIPENLFFDSLDASYKQLWQKFESINEEPNSATEPVKHTRYNILKGLYSFAASIQEPNLDTEKTIFDVIKDSVRNHPELSDLNIPDHWSPGYEEIESVLELDKPRGKWDIIRLILEGKVDQNKLPKLASSRFTLTLDND